MKTYKTPDVQFIHSEADVITSSGPSTVTGQIGNPIGNQNDIGAPGRRRIWD